MTGPPFPLVFVLGFIAGFFAKDREDFLAFALIMAVAAWFVWA